MIPLFCRIGMIDCHRGWPEQIDVEKGLPAETYYHVCILSMVCVPSTHHVCSSVDSEGFHMGAKFKIRKKIVIMASTN